MVLKQLLDGRLLQSHNAQQAVSGMELRKSAADCLGESTAGGLDFGREDQLRQPRDQLP
jgi:hypothetical protein